MSAAQESVLFVIVLLRTIWMFTKFDTPWLMIQGGGAETYIRTLPVYTYMRTFALLRSRQGRRDGRADVPGARGGRPRSTSASGSGRRTCEPQPFQPVRSARSLWRRSRCWSSRPFRSPGWPRPPSSSRRDLRDATDAVAAHLHARPCRRLFAETRFLTYFRNSLIVSPATVALTLRSRRLLPTA